MLQLFRSSCAYVRGLSIVSCAFPLFIFETGTRKAKGRDSLVSPNEFQSADNAYGSPNLRERLFNITAPFLIAPPGHIHSQSARFLAKLHFNQHPTTHMRWLVSSPTAPACLAAIGWVLWPAASVPEHKNYADYASGSSHDFYGFSMSL